jgi:hypothetical protein
MQLKKILDHGANKRDALNEIQHVLLAFNPGGGSQVNITYAALLALATGGTMVIGQKYRITDFRTRHLLRSANVFDFEAAGLGKYNTDSEDFPPAIEPLVVTAISATHLSLFATSELFPHDIIEYELVESSSTDPMLAHAFWDADRGRILYRKDTIQRVECWYDFRNVLTGVGCSVNEALEENRVYDLSVYDNDNDTAHHVKLVRTFNMDTYSAVFPEDNDWPYQVCTVTIKPVQFGAVPCNSFEGTTRKVFLDYGAEGYVFRGENCNLHIGMCNTIRLIGGANAVTTGENSGVVVSGAIIGLTVAARASLYSTSTVDNVQVLAPHTTDAVYTTPLANAVLGLNAAIVTARPDATDLATALLLVNQLKALMLTNGWVNNTTLVGSLGVMSVTMGLLGSPYTYLLCTGIHFSGGSIDTDPAPTGAFNGMGYYPINLTDITFASAVGMVIFSFSSGINRYQGIITTITVTRTATSIELTGSCALRIETQDNEFVMQDGVGAYSIRKDDSGGDHITFTTI